MYNKGSSGYTHPDNQNNNNINHNSTYQAPSSQIGNVQNINVKYTDKSGEPKNELMALNGTLQGMLSSQNVHNSH